MRKIPMEVDKISYLAENHPSVDFLAASPPKHYAICRSVYSITGGV
jgi:hypothetical protein